MPQVQPDDWEEPSSPSDDYYNTAKPNPNTRHYGSSEEGDEDDDDPSFVPVSVCVSVCVCECGCIHTCVWV